MKAMLIRVEPDDYAELHSLAKKKGRSLSNLVRLVLHDFVDAQTRAAPPPNWQARTYGGKRE